GQVHGARVVPTRAHSLPKENQRTWTKPQLGHLSRGASADSAGRATAAEDRVHHNLVAEEDRTWHSQIKTESTLNRWKANSRSFAIALAASLAGTAMACTCGAKEGSAKATRCFPNWRN